MSGKAAPAERPRRALVTGAHREDVIVHLADFETTFEIAAADRPDLVAMSYEDWLDLIDEREATAAYDATRGEETFPEPLIGRLLSSGSKIRAWREHRGLTLQALAEASGIAKGYLSDIETRKRRGSVDVLRKIASALKVDLDDLVA